ncbi:MAG: SRPBCC domain-containing protein [Acidobacteriota bacterium]
MSVNDRFEEHHQDRGDGRQLEFRLEIEAPREAVWRALTEAAELERWFPFQARVEPGVGGFIELSWDGAFDAVNRIEAWDRLRHLQTGWFEGDSPGPLLVDYFLEGEGGRTILRLVHHGFGADEDWDDLYDGIRHGWCFELRCLRHYLERHHGVDRRVIRVRQQLGQVGAGQDPDAGRDAAWSVLLGADGLVAVDTEAGGVSLRLDSSPCGELIVHRRSRELAVRFEAWNDSLLRFAVERMGGPGSPLEVWLWFETWGVDTVELRHLESALRQQLDRLLPP